MLAPFEVVTSSAEWTDNHLIRAWQQRHDDDHGRAGEWVHRMDVWHNKKTVVSKVRPESEAR